MGILESYLEIDAKQVNVRMFGTCTEKNSICFG